ncbi:endo-1,4-beta-xylanase [Cellulomonas fengjieae]|uniref:Beta-xylanase n=1 Tax=Cellulomonas fengjieae TaxID=2819978 RepID=A0ABS3SLN7_9CELL|nr:endo-1,4-beta-xylanase [Cellulomonas fengjieae]MBO3085881.1 endo-1,4-beta-xylanase [Cellulomonas fengjieae]QVI67424.1 endo-1,4-beta-xylanase [Cellulomonas fengjieae]
MPTPQHRLADAVVTVLDRDGHPLAHTDVVVAQQRHEFLFGNIGFDLVGLANEDEPARAEVSALADLWLDVFNAATLPFYWGTFEPVRGAPATDRLLRAARWFADRGVAVKGHPLAWHTVGAPWLLDLTTDEIADVQDARIRREVADFAGVIDTWDVINEVVIMPVFDKEPNGLTRLAWDRGRIPTIRLAFDAARQTNPSATLLLNDFDMSTAYECLIEGVLEAGIRVDALGLQSHMHQGYWGEEKTLAILDRFARFGLPLHLTETTLLSGELMPPHIEDLNDHQVASWPSTPEGEARQADEVERHYRTLVGHPAVQAATYWGITDDGAWLGAPGGLVRADGTPKPAYDALRALVKDEWWLAPTTVRTSAAGCLPVRGFRGTYSVDGVPFELAGDREVVVRLGG